jgi:hypothetical protein
MSVSSILDPLFAFLVCIVKWAVGELLYVLVWLVNGLIAGLMALFSPLIDLLPVIDLGSVTQPSWFAWVNWFFPMQFFVTLSLLIIGVLVVWRVVAIALRWLKVV